MQCLQVTFTLLALLQAALLVVGASFTETIQQCKNQTKSNEDEVNNVLMHQVPQTNNEKCMLACIQKKIEFMSTDNKMNLEKILKSIDHIKNFNMGRYEKMKKIYEDCSASEKAESDECIAAYSFAQCVYPKQMRIEGPLNINNYRISVSECSNKTGVNEDEKKSVLHHEIPSTKNAQCLLACMLKKAGILAADNKMNMEKIQEPLQNMKKYNNAMYNKTIIIFEECKAKETKENDECLAAKKFAECVYPKERLNRLGQKMRDDIAVCGNNTKAGELEIDTVIRHDVPKTKNEKCMFACLQKRMGAMNNDNTMDVEKIKSNFKHLKERQPEFYNKIEKILDECKAKETKEADECIAAGKFAECVYPKEKEIRDILIHQYHHHPAHN